MTIHTFGNLSYITALCLATAFSSHAQTFTTEFIFTEAQGYIPISLTQGVDGNLYGTSFAGGKHGQNLSMPGDGTVFRLSLDGTTQTVLYNFCSASKCADGLYPNAGLILAPNQAFYGTTESGGSGAYCNANPDNGCGSVFKMTADGTLTTLYSFCSYAACSDGEVPESPLVLAFNGYFYGTNYFGGLPGACGSALGCGTIFEITPSGQFLRVYIFCRSYLCPDGSAPQVPLVQGNDGNLYGVSGAGLTATGTFFSLNSSNLLTVLHEFSGTNDGMNPTGLIQASDGNFYGTAAFGGSGAYCGSQLCGTIFKVTPTGEFTTLYNFCSKPNCVDGSGPYAGLVQGTDGNLYGTTIQGGTHYNGKACAGTCGVIFKISPEGQFSTLYNFCSQANCADGVAAGAIMQATNGNFYGTTQAGGVSGGCRGIGCGTIFSLSMGLPPFVQSNPWFGHVHQPVNILGNNLTGAATVTFNGVAAKFKVISPSYIQAEVPVGATTGSIQVTTPTATLSSNGAFQVLP